MTDVEEFYDDMEDERETGRDSFSEETETDDVDEDEAGVMVNEGFSEEGSDDGQELTDEELDKVADTAIETLREILSYFGDEESAIDEYEGDEGEILLDIVGENHAVIIGRHGRTLDSIQLLVTSIVNKKLGYRYPIIIDVEGYKYRRQQKIREMASKAASRANRQQSPVRMRPMSSYERRVVHLTLKNDDRVYTESEGQEPYRYVVVIPYDNQ
jgi:spoIIIJ-associated protein